MSDGRAGRGAVAALLLAVAVLAAFGSHQMSGPEGALLKFLDAVQRQRADDVVSAVGGERSVAARMVAEIVSSEMRRGARFVAVEIKRDRGQATALVRIEYPRGSQYAMFLLASRGGRWHVDAPGTAMYFGVPVL
jgi:hypothetical protein